MLRPATDSDIATIRQWRNHPDVRAVSVYQHEISPDEHAAWWQRVRADDRTLILILELAGTPSGVVTFTAIGRTATWGFYLDVDGLTARGETLSAWIAVGREAIDYAFDELDLEALHGEVLEHNTVVRQMNRRCGFTESEPIHREVDGRVVASRDIQLRREARRIRQKGHA
jgi:UDP-4-amino-4,6-dideoxy-N-acetyl-beta-L-altrosamine N-acetyltransferase